MTTTLDNFESVLNFESDFFCSADFCELPHKISRALARFSVLAHADFILRRTTNPKGLKNVLPQTFDLLYHAALAQSQENENNNDENEDNMENDDTNDDIGDDMGDNGNNGEIDSEAIKKVQASIESLAILLQTFPNVFKDHFSELVQLFYK